MVSKAHSGLINDLIFSFADTSFCEDVRSPCHEPRLWLDLVKCPVLVFIGWFWTGITKMMQQHQQSDSAYYRSTTLNEIWNLSRHQATQGLLRISVVLISVCLSIQTANAFNLTCTNVSAIQGNLGPAGMDYYNAATDSGVTVFKRDRDKLVSDYMGMISFEGDLVKEGFRSDQNMIEYYEFQDVDSSLGYNEITTIMRSSLDGMYRVIVTHTGNNDGQLYQRSYWYECR